LVAPARQPPALAQSEVSRLASMVPHQPWLLVTCYCSWFGAPLFHFGSFMRVDFDTPLWFSRTPCGHHDYDFVF
jgi:hypothetical protein